MPETIILAEDDGTTRVKVATLLEDMGYQVREFTNGVDAWAAFDKEPARIVISDWKMPGMEGTDLCMHIRNRRATDYTYFLLITAMDPGAIGYDYSIGVEVDDFLLKPIERGALWRRIRVAERILSFTTQMRQMEALLPICSYCHKIRDEERKEWESLENYVHERTGSSFTHGVCPTCAAQQVSHLGGR